MSRSWDVFCRVIDNYGDAAVCWRLALQLANEHGGRVRLWIDELAPLQALCPEVDVAQERQSVGGVEILRQGMKADCGPPAEIVIDAFGGGLADGYVEAMAAREPRSLWIVLEYLSAESWVPGHHGLPSPHPRLPLERYFFFPGVAAGTGGVLRESGLEARRAAFLSSGEGTSTFWSRLDMAAPAPGTQVVSMFGYENDGVVELLQALADGPGPVVVAVTAGRLRAQVEAFFAGAAARGRAEARYLPFLPQPAYDELLWACDWNFVRGEDSFVRAQWARRPFAWQVYPQDGEAHVRKLEAFLDVYCRGLEPGSEAALRGLWRGWNGVGGPSGGRIREAWKVLSGHREGLRRHASDWSEQLGAVGDLATNLAQYCEERLK